MTWNLRWDKSMSMKSMIVYRGATNEDYHQVMIRLDNDIYEQLKSKKVDISRTVNAMLRAAIIEKK